jgi:hypothetical protein
VNPLRLLPPGASNDAALLVETRALRALGDGVVSVILATYLTAEQTSEVYRAYLFGAEAHQGQMRQTGEPYIYHPIAVARILGEFSK